MPLRYPPPNSPHEPYSLHVGQLFRSMLDGRSGQSIIGSHGQVLDYPTLGQRVHRLANVLTALGVSEGDVVAVLDWDSHRFLECYFAVPMLGAVLQTVNVRLPLEQISYTLAHTQATILLFHRDFEALVVQLASQLPDLQQLIVLQDEPAQRPALRHAGEYEQLLAQSSPLYPFPEIDEHALATTFHTTGTTGLPKAVAFSHRQLVLHTLSVMAALGTQPAQQGLRRGDVYMPITPMFHVHAWGIPYIASTLGLKQVYPGRYDPQRLLQLRRQHRVTFSHCVPTLLQMLLDAHTAQDHIGLGWTVLVGGSALPEDLHRRAKACGITALSGYGMSETAPVLAIARTGDETGAAAEAALCSTGHPIPLVQLRLVDAAMQMLPAGDQHWGELVVRAPWLTASYPGDRPASEQLWRGGWLHTQDIASQAVDGRLQIRDRLKDVIKTGGEWVSSVAMEALAATHPQIVAAAFVGVADAQWGERPVAFVVARGDATLDDQAVREHLSSYVASGVIARYAVPERIIFIDKLPLTSVGKVDKKALRASLDHGQ